MGRPTVSVDRAVSHAGLRAGEKEEGRQWAEDEQEERSCHPSLPPPPSTRQARPLLPSAASVGSPQQEHHVRQLLLLTPVSSVRNESFLSALPSSAYAVCSQATSPMEGKAMCVHPTQGKVTLLPLCGLDSHRYTELGFGPRHCHSPTLSVLGL